MAIKVQIRRGTKAQLTTYGALSAGELGYTTDEKLVYVGDGTTASNFLVGRCASGSGAPSGNLIAGTVYFDTAADRFYFCNGSSWEAAAINPLAINDAGTGNTDLWSAQKIQSAIDAAVFGIGEFLESVLDRASSPPGSPTSGDRYIIVATATGAWVGKENQVAEYVTNAWQYTSATEGMCAYVDDEDLLYIYNGTSWVPINNYALASTEPGAVSSSTSGQVGTGTTLARADHNHDLGPHLHSGANDGGLIPHSNLSGIGANDHHNKIHSGLDHTGVIGTWAQIDLTNSSLADIANRSHSLLTDVGVNTHASIDSYLANHNHDGTNSAEIPALDAGVF